MESYTILLSFIYCFIFERKSSILCRKKQILIGRSLALQLYGARCSARERKCIINTNCSVRKRSKRPDIHSIFKVLVKDNATNEAWYDEGSEVTPFKSGLLFNLGPPVIQGSKVLPPPKIPRNSPNGEMEEGQIWVWSTIQTDKMQIANNREDFEQ